MRYIGVLKIAGVSIIRNKMRSVLTILGMVIGISSVIIVYSAGEGISRLILDQIESFGTDIIETEIKVPTSKKGSAAERQSAVSIVQGVQITTLNLDDLEDLKKIDNVADGYAAVMGQEQVNYGNEIKKAFLLGVSASYINIDKSDVEYGRFYTESEDKSLAKVAVLGSKMKEKLFGDSDPIGQSIKIKKIKFRVIGVMEERGAVMTLDYDDFVYIPVHTLQKRIMGINNVMYMVHQLYDISKAEETAAQARVILRENHDIPPPEEERKSAWEEYGKDDFRVVTMTEMMDMMDTVTGAITLLLLAIVAISLVVGGVGIMNIMYVVVTERTAEIGLRKAVGAKYSDIMTQFLIESVFITLLGGVFGIIFGILFSYGLSLGANSYGLEWTFTIPTKAYVAALSFSTFFGLAFGLYPARKAAQLDPIKALSNE